MELKKKLKENELIRRAFDNQLLLNKALINGTPNPMYIRNTDAELVSCNEAYHNSPGIQVKDARNIYTSDGFNQFSPRVVAEYRNDFSRVLNENVAIIKDRVLEFNDGRQDMAVYHWMTPYSDDSGRVQGVVGGWIDITDRKWLEEHLREMQIESELASAAKSEFLTVMSHELRTPLNAIIGMLELGNNKLKQGIIDNTAFEVAQKSSFVLLELIGNILDIRKIEANSLVLQFSKVNLKALMEQMVLLFKGNADTKGVDLNIELNETAAHHTILTDELRLRQIISNIICNAIKFTDEGSVNIVVTLSELNLSQLIIRVTDTGCGIPQDKQKLLFRPFSQVSSTPAQRKMGTGLGLVISRSLCEALGGKMSLKSEPGAGTEICIELDVESSPAEDPDTGGVSSVSSCVRQNIRVLIVDDYYPNLLVLEKQLAWLDYQTIVCDEPSKAFDIWQMSKAHVVFTDCNMHGISGIELAAMIRSASVDTVILGFTADARNEQREACIKAGMDDCLFKPTTLEMISATLNRYLGNKEIHNEVTQVQELSLCHDLDFMHTLYEHSLMSVSDVHDAITVNDFKKMADLAHKMKGGFTLIKHVRFVDICTELEALATEHNEAECLRLTLLLEEEVNDFFSAD